MTALMPQAMTLDDRNIQDTLYLSESRAYDAALHILAAHKLTGNFRVNLEIVLKDIGAFDNITYEIKPKSKPPYYPDYPDCRHVVFWPNEHVHMDRFSEIMRSIEARIGFDLALPWWVKVSRLDVGK